mgnify:FL=1|jgi:hypothetical protein
MDPIDILTNPNVPDMGFGFDLELDLDKAPAYDWSAGDDKPEKNFLDVFTDELQKSGYFDQSKNETKRRDVYGDRRRSSGDTVADLGGGNTAVNPDTSSLIQSQLAMANQQQQPGLGQTIAGAGGTAIGTSIGGPLGGTIGGGIGSFLGGLLPF